MTGKNRRTLDTIQSYPRPVEIYDRITLATGWRYKVDRERYLKRDRALVALTFLIAGRISEVLRLTTGQFSREKDRIIIKGIKLSKARRKDKLRRKQFREEAFLTLTGERSKLTELVLEYLNTLTDENQKLFPFGTSRAWQIITNMTGYTCHYLRAFGENYLYDKWEKDILAVADYVKVDPRTLALYIRRSYAKYKPA